MEKSLLLSASSAHLSNHSTCVIGSVHGSSNLFSLSGVLIATATNAEYTYDFSPAGTETLREPLRSKRASIGHGVLGVGNNHYDLHYIFFVLYPVLTPVFWRHGLAGCVVLCVSPSRICFSLHTPTVAHLFFAFSAADICLLSKIPC